jgi:hypothetical protein
MLDYTLSTVTSCKWLGVRYSDLENQGDNMQQFSTNDQKILNGLLNNRLVQV